MAIATTGYDKAQRKISTANLAQFAGVDCQLLVEKETHRPIIMDGATLGGKFKCASLDEVDQKISAIPAPDLSSYLTKSQASTTYLGVGAKAKSAQLADRATVANSASSVAGSAVSGAVAEATHAVNADNATNATKAASAVVADSANSVAGANVTGTVASATKATQDASGNVITSTYATKTEVNAKAPAYTYSTTDLMAGSSSLATGKLYFVYE